MDLGIGLGKLRVVAAAAVLILAVPTSPAGFAAASDLAIGSIVVVADPGIALHVPADGRINGDAFAAQITGYRFAHQVGIGSSSTTAAKGQRLLVFGLQGAPLVAGTDEQGNPTPTVTPLLMIDGAQQPLPAPTTQDSGPTYYLASIPSTASDVSIEIPNQGFSQTFSFTTGARTGPQPAVLYRSQSSWQATDAVAQTITMATPDPAENIAGAEIDVTLNSASLTWFGPDSPSDPPANEEMAWLVLDATSQAHPISPVVSGFALNYLSTLPPAAVTLTVPGQAKPVAASIGGRGGPSDQSKDQSGFFGGVYYWPVPADLTAATVKITPGTISAESNYLGSEQTITVKGSAVFPLSFGPPYQPPPAPASPPADAPGTPQAAASLGGGGGFPVGPVVAAAILALALAAGVLLVRRRQARPALQFAGIGANVTAPPPPQSPPPRPPTESAAPVVDPAPESSGGSTSSGPATRPSGAPVIVPTSAREPVLLVPPDRPPPLPAGALRIGVFGPNAIEGWPPDVALPGQTVVETLTFLALHPGQRFTTEQLRSRLGMGRDRDRELATIRKYLGDLRRALGEDRVPETKAGGAYEVRGITTDAAEFRAAIEEARGAATPVEKANHLATALSFVRGAPFADAPKGSYGWADTDPNLAAGFANSILRAAGELANLAIDAGDADLASWAADRGLLVSPTGEGMHELYLTAADIAIPSRLAAAWVQTNDRLAAHGEEPSARLVAHYQQLRQRLSGWGQRE